MAWQSFFKPGVFIRGLGMGAADVVPGVSGGTIAFITGIYEELVNSIKGLHPSLLKSWHKEGFSAFWKKGNLGFLLSLGLGVAISILSLAKGVSFALEHYAIATWAFFFGLILASAWYIGKQVKNWNFIKILLLIIGTVIAYYISTLTPANGSSAWWYGAISGAVAICAMILPGISGSLILLLLGMYAPVLAAVNERDITFLLPVVLGGIIGLLSFSHLLSYLFKHYKYQTLALLTGFMLGALNKVWPWKEVLSTYTDSHNMEQPLHEKSILPNVFAQIHGEPAQIGIALVAAFFGIAVVLIIELLSQSKNA